MISGRIPKHVRLIRPSIWIVFWSVRSGVPGKTTRLLEEALEGAPTRTTVQKYGDFVPWLSCRGLVDEEKRIAGVGVINRNQAGVELADVERDVWERLDEIL